MAQDTEKVIQAYKQVSKNNLNKFLNKFKKYKIVVTEGEVDLVQEGLCFYHCVRPVNINSVLRTREIKVKNDITNMAETTNTTTDFIHGFDKHLSFSIGEPWLSYGPYCFVYGLGEC